MDIGRLTVFVALISICVGFWGAVIAFLIWWLA